MNKFYKRPSPRQALLMALVALMTTACEFTDTPEKGSEEPAPDPLKTVTVLTTDQLSDKLTRPVFFSGNDSRFSNAVGRRLVNEQKSLTQEPEVVIVDQAASPLHESDFATLAEIFAGGGAIAWLSPDSSTPSFLSSLKEYCEGSEEYSADTQLLFDFDCGIAGMSHYVEKIGEVSPGNIECLMVSRRSLACVTLPDNLDLVSDYELGRLADLVVSWLENNRSQSAAVWKSSVVSPRQKSYMSLMTYDFGDVIKNKPVVRSVPVNIALDFVAMSEPCVDSAVNDTRIFVSQNIWVGNSALFCPVKQFEWTLAQLPAIAFGPYMRAAEIKNNLTPSSSDELSGLCPKTSEGSDDMEISSSVDFKCPAVFEGQIIESGDLSQSVSAVNQLKGFEIGCQVNSMADFKWSYTNSTPLSVRLPVNGGSPTHPAVPLNMCSDINLTQTYTIDRKQPDLWLDCSFDQILELQSTPGIGWNTATVSQGVKFSATIIEPNF